MWLQRKKTNGETFLLVFVESALARAPCCVPYVSRCEFQDPERRRRRKKKLKKIRGRKAKHSFSA